MADLDDFFAKKDRKKSKSTKKFATTDEVAKKLEDSAKKSEKIKKERVPEGDETSVPDHEQDEWKEFEEEKKDYTGLKIGNLTISAQPEGVTGVAEPSVEQQCGAEEPGQENDKKQGPWKRIDSEVQEEAPRPVEKKVEPAPPKVVGGAYVPPSMRNQSQQAPIQPARLRTKAAPDIHNEEYFPTLSKTSADHKKNRSEGNFEVVQHNRGGSHRQVEQAKANSGQGPKLSLENRYNTLSES